MLYALDGIEPDVPEAGTWWSAPDAHLIGKVSLAAGVGVWFGSVLRGDNELIAIGSNSNIQEACILHTDMGFPLTVGERCTVGHRALLHGCTIGDGTLIGMGAIVLNGAKIGRNCIVGANALVTAGKVFPDNSMIIGSPARVVREVTPEERIGIQNSASSYVRRWKQYAAGLKAMPAA